MTTHCKWALSQNVFSHVYRFKVRCKNFTIHAASALKKRKGYRVYVCVFETFLQWADWVRSICGVWEMLLSLRQQMRQMERKMMKKGGRKKNAKNWDMMEITGTALTIPYWRWMFSFFVSYIANARTFFGIPVHKFPFIHLFHFPKPVSVSSDT